MRPLGIIALALSLSACASSRSQRLGPGGELPSPAEYDSMEPVWWSMPAMTPLPSTLHSKGATLTPSNSKAAWTIEADSRRFVFSTPVRTTTAGLQIDRGFMSRATHQQQVNGRTLDELWIETFRGSPIISFFRRQWDLKKNLGSSHLDIEGQSCEAHWFVGDALRHGTPDRIHYPVAQTTKPFVVLHDKVQRRGVIVFFALPPELRTWHAEDYELEQQFDLHIEIKRSTTGCRLSLPQPAVASHWSRGRHRRSVERQIFVMPYRGAWRQNLKQLHIAKTPLGSGKSAFGRRLDGGYWQIPPQSGSSPVHFALRMLRYFPTEFVSWVGTARLPYGHDKGLTWGLTTKTMKGTHLRPNARRALDRDLANRMLVFFLEAGAEKGAPPNLLTHPDWALQFQDPSKIREVVFTQYWEFRLEEFAELLRSPRLRPSEKARVYDDLQRARVVHDPDGKHTWTTRTPNGGVWFDYFDEPLGGINRFVVNTHATTIGNVGEFALLARDFGRPDDLEYWQDLFHKGVLGLKWATNESWSWTAGDNNELVYSRIGTGPSNYHYWMLTSWVPRAARLAMELAPDDVEYLLQLMERLGKARFMTEQQRSQGERILSSLREREKGDAPFRRFRRRRRHR